MGLEAASLAVMSTLHLSGILAGGANMSDHTQAGIAEAIIGVVLLGGAVALRRGSRTAARFSVGFAIVGFIIGLSFALPSGDAIDITYHSTVLPVLVITFAALHRNRTRGQRHALTERQASIGILPCDSEQAVGEAEVQRCCHE
jgi:hypothetical protein